MKLKFLLKHPILYLGTIKRRRLPVVNLDDTLKNCPVCGYNHDYKTKYNKKYYSLFKK